jgi:hypothetical protein
MYRSWTVLLQNKQPCTVKGKNSYWIVEKEKKIRNNGAGRSVSDSVKTRSNRERRRDRAPKKRWM